MRTSRGFRAPPKTFKLSDVLSGDPEAIKVLWTLFQDEQQGLPFVKDGVLPEHSFIAIEAIWWCIDHCDEIHDEHTALLLFQVTRPKSTVRIEPISFQSLFACKLVRHCTHAVNTFRFGFFLYYLVSEKTTHCKSACASPPPSLELLALSSSRFE